jgi:type IV secretory pathway VirB2 component (pilin)
MKKLIDTLGVHGTIAVAILIAATLFLAVGKMNADQWIDLAKWTLGIFSTTHAAMHVATARVQRAQPIPAATVVADSKEKP